MISQQVKPLGDALAHPIGEINIAAVLEEIERDVLEVGFGLRRKAIR